MKRYVDFDFNRPYKPDPGLWFECLECGDSVRSAPKVASMCSCKNISIGSFLTGRPSLLHLK